ncbi:MarR family winged helix-turn-helix transcriptional regulator [Aeromicrobium sp.]|uniref:MarR family winged helix-turn-helix transcriptional regulator n=1 Tax=Aeromicrobium sp. TaxID=1871063 RepID=UPI002FC8152B
MSDEKLAASWHELMGRYNQLTCRLDRELGAQHDLSSSEFEVLQLLHAAKPDGKVRMSVLAEHAHLSQSALSRLVSRLEKDGLVCRNTCSDDRRAQWTEITPAGRERYEAARPTHRKILREEAGDCAQLAAGVLLPADR